MSSIAKKLFREEWRQLTPHEKEVIEGALHRITPPRNANIEFSDHRTLGQRAADAIAGFGGSWTFIIIFGIVLLSWVILNTEILRLSDNVFDPYPFIFLNLILSMLAAIQAPIIMMSQNRQSERDRLEAEIDHEVNVRAELSIRDIDERLHLIETKLEELKNKI